MVFRWSVCAPEESVVTVVRRRVGLPHDGQNFLEGSLHTLERQLSMRQQAQAIKETEMSGNGSTSKCGRGYREGRADSLETRMTPKHPALHFTYPLPTLSNEPEPNTQQDILHSKVSSHACRRERPPVRFAPWSDEPEIPRAVRGDVGGGDPFPAVGLGFCISVFGRRRVRESSL